MIVCSLLALSLFAAHFLLFVYASPNDTWSTNEYWRPHDIFASLGRKLSPNASISPNGKDTERWSTYKAPKAGMVVDVATEEDILWTVRYCIHYNIPFLAQNGGNAWATTFNLSSTPSHSYVVTDTVANSSSYVSNNPLPASVLINLRALSSINFSLPPTSYSHPNARSNLTNSPSSSLATVTIGGGVLTSSLIEAGHAQGVQVLTGNCNCVGLLGASLGGGYSRYQGLYGLGVDNILSVNLVTADGRTIILPETKDDNKEQKGVLIGDTAEEQREKQDLWWALRGAGPNFGIVTSATLKAYPISDPDKSGAWLASLVFAESHLEEVVRVVESIDISDRMAVFLYFFAPPPACKPSIVVELFYANCGKDGEEEARNAFKDIFNIGKDGEYKEMDAGWHPYDRVNDNSEMFCAKDGARKPTWGAGLARVDPGAIRKVWELYKNWVGDGKKGTEKSAVLVEKYPMKKVLEVGDGDTAFAWRKDIRFNTAAIAWYKDPELDAKAEEWGQSVRRAFREGDADGKGERRVQDGGEACNRSYINYAFGDETAEEVYGGNLERLRGVKRYWDPQGKFSQFFPL